MLAIEISWLSKLGKPIFPIPKVSAHISPEPLHKPVEFLSSHPSLHLSIQFACGSYRAAQDGQYRHNRDLSSGHSSDSELGNREE